MIKHTSLLAKQLPNNICKRYSKQECTYISLMNKQLRTPRMMALVMSFNLSTIFYSNSLTHTNECMCVCFTLSGTKVERKYMLCKHKGIGVHGCILLISVLKLYSNNNKENILLYFNGN